MAGKPGPLLIAALQLLIDHEGQMTPYAAARHAGIALSTMYRAPLYKAWKDATDEADPARRRARLRAVRLEVERRAADFTGDEL